MDAQRVVLRQRGGQAAAVFAWVLCAVLALLGLGARTPGDTAATLCATAAAALTAWLVLWRPALVVDPGLDLIVVVNPLRTHHIPTAAVVSWQVGGLAAIRARTSAGTRRFVSWNAPGVPRRHADRGTAADPTTRVLKQLHPSDRPPGGREAAVARTTANPWWLLVAALGLVAIRFR